MKNVIIALSLLALLSTVVVPCSYVRGVGIDTIWVIPGIGPLIFTSSPITRFVTNHFYSYQAQLNNMSGVSWSLSSPPPWLSVNGTGAVSGVAETGTFQVSLKAMNVTSTVWQNFTLDISSLSPTDMIFIVFIVVILALIGMAILVHPMLGVFGGVVTFFFALWLFTITANTLLTVIVFGFGAFIIVGSMLMDTDRSGRRGPLGG